MEILLAPQRGNKDRRQQLAWNPVAFPGLVQVNARSCISHRRERDFLQLNRTCVVVIWVLPEAHRLTSSPVRQLEWTAGYQMLRRGPGRPYPFDHVSRNNIEDKVVMQLEEVRRG